MNLVDLKLGFLRLTRPLREFYMDFKFRNKWLFLSLPSYIKILFMVVVAIALFNVVFSLYKAVKQNLNNWKENKKTGLYYSFLGGSGQHLRIRVRAAAYKFSYDKSSSILSFAGIANSLGKIEHNSKFVLFLYSLIYMPFMLLGMMEMLFRVVFSLLLYTILDVFFALLLLILKLINYILIPVFLFLDKRSYVTQHCQFCYTTFKLPSFDCPNCHKTHEHLYPGVCGLLWARCTCGAFIPCSSLSGRKNIRSRCPSKDCMNLLIGANVRDFIIQIVGGNSSGKTAYLASFFHHYLNSEHIKNSGKIKLLPEEDFENLEASFVGGATEKSPENIVNSYRILHEDKGPSDSSFIFYDFPDEMILSEQYDRNPLNFGYSHGIMIMIDPLSSKLVRDLGQKNLASDYLKGYSADSPEDIVVHFINKYSEIAGRKAKKMSTIPVAIVITKTDIPIVEERIGAEKIEEYYKENLSGSASLYEARDSVCRAYLLDIGFENLLNNIESVFTNVSFFPVSAMGHSQSLNTCFEPRGVVEPAVWIADFNKGVIDGVISAVLKEVR